MLPMKFAHEWYSCPHLFDFHVISLIYIVLIILSFILYKFHLIYYSDNNKENTYAALCQTTNTVN